MPNAPVIAQFERRLAEMGCPSRQLTEHVHELAEHHEDLKQAALDEGLSEEEAVRQASTRLGHPILLAENVLRSLRQSSWWGRHPMLGFCVLPILAFDLAWALCLTLMGALTWLLGVIFGPAYRMTTEMQTAIDHWPKMFDGSVALFNTGINLAAVFLVLVVFYRLGQRVGIAWKWRLAAAAACAFACLFSTSAISVHNISCGFSSNPCHKYCAVIPLLFAAGLLAYRWRVQRRFANVPRCGGKIQRPALASGKRTANYKTPTFWITTTLALVIVKLVAAPLTDAFLDIAKGKQEDAKVWPAERAATMALLKTHQLAAVRPADKTINLKPFLNGTLADSIGEDKTRGDNLLQLPSGVHTFGGVPFDVTGRIQLAGNALSGTDGKLPTRVSIPLSGKCSRIYLLQGAFNLTTGSTIAWLVLRYKNGSSAKLDIVGGKDVLDWWGPIYNTDAGDDRYTTSPDTELAWAGSNAAIEKDAPEYSLRLYRTALVNPHPEREVTGIDYVSSLSGAAPFLVGLTIEAR